MKYYNAAANKRYSYRLFITSLHRIYKALRYLKIFSKSNYLINIFIKEER